MLSKSISNDSLIYTSTNKKVFTDEVKNRLNTLKLDPDKCNIINSFRKTMINSNIKSNRDEIFNDVIP